MEMKMLRHQQMLAHGSSLMMNNQEGIFFKAQPQQAIAPTPNMPGNGNIANDIGSIDSSDTYASCNTHPFRSQDDLKSDIVDVTTPSALDSNLYINPFDKNIDERAIQKQRQYSQRIASGGPGVVKKSASGDTALRSLGTSPMDEAFRFGTDRGSRGSLNDSPLPKHRKTRFQQVCIF